MKVHAEYFNIHKISKCMWKRNLWLTNVFNNFQSTLSNVTSYTLCSGFLENKTQRLWMVEISEKFSNTNAIKFIPQTRVICKLFVIISIIAIAHLYIENKEKFNCCESIKNETKKLSMFLFIKHSNCVIINFTFLIALIFIHKMCIPFCSSQQNSFEFTSCESVWINSLEEIVASVYISPIYSLKRNFRSI